MNSLSISNRFSQDAHKWLTQIAESCGQETMYTMRTQCDTDAALLQCIHDAVDAFMRGNAKKL